MTARDPENRILDLSRFLSPDGNWLSQDPSFFGPGALADANLYSFVGGNPVSRWDPSGLFSIGELATTMANVAVSFGTRAISVARTYLTTTKTLETLSIITSIAFGVLQPERVGAELVFTFELQKGLFRDSSKLPKIQLAISRNSTLDGILQIRADWDNGARLRVNLDLNNKDKSDINGGWNIAILDTYPKLDAAFRFNPSSGQVKLALLLSLPAPGFLPVFKDLKYAFPILTWDKGAGFKILGIDGNLGDGKNHEFF